MYHEIPDSIWGAAFNNNTTLLESLIQEQVDVNSLIKGTTPLFAALMGDSKKAFRLLLENNANPRITINKISILRSAIDFEITSATEGDWKHGYTEENDLKPNPVYSSLLLKHGADAFHTDSDGYNAFQDAQERHHLSFLDYLKQQGKV